MDAEVLEDLVVGRVEPHIYAFTTNTVPNYLKVGDTYRPVEVRLDEWRDFYPSLRHEYDESACVSDEIFFRDFSVHDYLENTRHLPRLTARELKPGIYFSKEFFRGACKADVKAAIADIRKDFETSGQRYQFYKAVDRLPTEQKYPSTGMWKIRPKQEETVGKFEAAVAKGRKNLLMYAVMRFGKSFTAMCCAKTMNGGNGAKLVVVVSAKADVCDEWRRTVESAENFRNDYEFFSSKDLVRNPKVVTDHIRRRRGKAVVFLTLQDLQDEETKRKHRHLLKEKVDLLVVDETHYGARADSYGRILRATKDKPSRRDLEDADAESETKEVVKAFKVRVTLHLSGTPYRILMGSEFAPDDIIAFVSFTDIAEAQTEWDAENAKKPEAEQEEEWDNPYFGFPQMIRFAFRPNASTRARLEALKKGGATYAFSALFEPKSIAKDEGGDYRRFKYEQEVLDLFQVIDGSKKDDALLGFLDYPKLKEGKMCRHIVCVLPYCASCDALAALLKRKRTAFKNLGDYEIVNVSGHDMPREYGDVGDVKRAIADFEKAGKKTLTLTVNRMLTGSTVPEWDTMLYFKDTASAQEYDQAIFRLQNQYMQEMSSVAADGTASVVKFNKKPQTLLVDFDPERLFRMQEAKAKFYNVNDDKGGNAKLEERLKKEIAYSPIVTLNAGKLRQAEAADIMAAVSAYSRTRGVSDEVFDAAVDLSALGKSPELLQAVLKETLLKNKQGFEMSAHVGEEDDLDVPDSVGTFLDNAKNNKDPSGDRSAATSEEEKARKELEAKLRAYYSRLLFFAFLTKDKVQSVEDIVKVMSKGENARIARNVGISKDVLKAILKHFDKFILSDLDYKIRNLDTLSVDDAVDPVERATTALRKFDRLGPSEIMTPEKIADEMVALLPEDELRRIARDGEKILDISGKAGEFAIALFKRYRAIDPKIDVRDLILTIPTSGHAYEFTRKVYEALGLDVGNIAAKFTAYDLIEVRDRNTGAVDYARIKKLLTQRKPFCEITMKDRVANRGKHKTVAAVVGNPPYQLETATKKSETNGQAPRVSIFHHVQVISDYVAAHYTSLIYPGKRWIHRSGKGMDEFGYAQINDVRLEQVDFFAPNEKVFNVVEIADGLTIVLKNAEKKSPSFKYVYHGGGAVDEYRMQPPGDKLLPLNPKDGRIVDKVASYCQASKISYLSRRILPRSLFGIESEFVELNPSKVRLYGKNSPVDFSKEIKLLTNDKAGKAGRAKWFVANRNVIGNNQQYIDEWQVVVSSANAGGQKRDWQIELIDNHSAFGRSRVGLGSFKTRQEAENFYKYCTSYLIRFLFLMTDESLTSLAKQVPDIQDYSNNYGLIDFHGDVNRQLYHLFELTDSEIKYVEKTIRDIDGSRSRNAEEAADD